MVRQILVVKRDKIFPKGAFQGFLPIDYKDFLTTVKDNFLYMERNDALENNSEYLQIIPYVWLINPLEKKAFIYKRAQGQGEYHEKRHLNKISGGVGGHIDKESSEPADPVMFTAIREMNEEVVMNNYPQVHFIGYLNDDSNIYNQVHFGIVGLAKTTEHVKPADGMASGDFYSVDEIDRMFSNPENEIEPWTKVSWPYIKSNYLSS